VTVADRVNPIERFIFAAERHAFEMGVTLLIHGQVVTGTITPFRRFGRWMSEVQRRAALAGGKFQPPADAEMLALTESQAEEIREEWDAREANFRKERGLGDNEDLALHMDLEYFCLRDAGIRAGSPMSWITVPYLLLRTASVDAFFPGRFSGGTL
jgi:hypothetical protein